MTDAENTNWIACPVTEPEIFIDAFVKHAGENNIDNMCLFAKHYRSGYCWHFAHTLQTVFDRGEVCWAAPFGHMVWLDDDGTPYDIEGKYQGEYFYLIPESYLLPYRHELMHIRGIQPSAFPVSSKEDLIAIVKQYCHDTGETYDPDIEKYFRKTQL